MYTLYIFRRDLRLNDNIGINYVIKNFDNIIPIFIFTPEQITDKNKFKSNNAIQFMIESLQELDNNLKKNNSKLYFFKGDNIKIINKIIKQIKITNIVFNMDYTPYAIKRDNDIAKICKKNNINCYMVEDYLLKPIGTFNKKDNTAYTIFTPFKNNGMKFNIDKPLKYTIKNFVKTSYLNDISLKNNDVIKILKTYSDTILLKGGRENGLKYLNKIKEQKEYNDTRNTLSLNTTLLSAYIKFGCISIREVYWKIVDTLGTKNDLLGQLFWREFYYYICYYYPKVLNGKNYNEKYDKIKWKYNKNHFDKWTNGQTGYPVVDAGMIELKTSGYMHNRARLITSNFLNRMLGMDWRKGELYYATQLTDYDPAVNNGNWQWIASTGTDPKPYFQRLFNPWLQSEKYDKDAEYIKKWLPQLKDIPSKELHEWDKYCDNYDVKKLGYYKPVVEYKKAREESIKMYK